MSLPKSLSGGSGKVVLLAPHQGKLTLKYGDVCFTRAVVAMPDSKPPPASLLKCMQIGDALHFDADLTEDPVLHQPMYRASKVWFPNSKVKTNKLEDDSSSGSPNSASEQAGSAEILCRFILQALWMGPQTFKQLAVGLEPIDAKYRSLYENSTAGLRKFVTNHPGKFSIAGDSVVLVPSKNPSGGKNIVDHCIEAIQISLRPCGSMHYSKLHDLLKSYDKDVREFIFSVSALRSFLDIHRKEFLVGPDGFVSVIKQPRKKSSSAARKPDLHDLPSEKPFTNTTAGPKVKKEDGKEVNAKVVSCRYVKSVLKSQGPLTLEELTVWVNLAPAEVHEHVGRTTDAVLAYLRVNSCFKITKNGTVIYEAYKKGNVPVVDLSSLPTYHRDAVVHIAKIFGFIRNGTNAADNIFFHLSSCTEADGNLTDVLKIGDVVDSLYMISEDKRNRYCAVRVWKVPDVESSDKSPTVESSLLALPTVLSSEVCYGESAITYLSGEVGYCVLQGDRDSLINLEGKNTKQRAIIDFHLGHIVGDKLDPSKLHKGTRLMFVAHQKQTRKESATDLWSAVSMWPSKSKASSAAKEQTEKFSVTAEVQELTSEGGRLSFGKNPWAEGICFTWKQVLSNSVGLHNKTVCINKGDTFWCIVAGGHMSRGDSTKWVAVELIPCDLSMDSEPPHRFTACPAVPLSHDLSNSKFGSLNRIPSEEMTPVERTCSPATSESSSTSDGNELLLDLGSPSGSCISNQSDAVADGSAKLVSKDQYGGLLESGSGDVLKFNAHAFYFNGVPVSHLVFPEGTQVHYDGGRSASNGELVATRIWIGKRPVENGKCEIQS